MLKVIRCAESNCRRFLGKEDIKLGEIHLKCPKCKNWTVVRSKVISKEEIETKLDKVDIS